MENRRSVYSIFGGGDRGLEYKPSGYAYQYLSSILPNGSYFEDGFDLVLPVGSQKSSIHFYYFYTNRNSTLLFLWSTNLEYSSELTLPTEGGGGIFDAMEFDYFTNESNWVSSQTNFQVNIGYTPVLIELEYQDFLGTLGLENTPLIFRVDLNYSREIRFVLIFVPSILVIGGMIGLASSISQKKDLKKEN